MKKDLLREIKESIVQLDQNSLFQSDVSEEKVSELCVQYLRSKGYTVAPPKIFSGQVKNLRELVDHFYKLLNFSNPENYVGSYNLKKDLGIAKRFVESRMLATGAAKEYALNECGEIIKTVIENQSTFKFKYSLNFSLFGQSNMRWVTDKALDIMNKNLKVKNEEYEEQLRQQSVEAQDTSDLGFDLDSILSRMEEEEHGKEKE